MATSRLLTTDLVAPGVLHPRGSCRQSSHAGTFTVSRLDAHKVLQVSDLRLLQHKSAEGLRIGAARLQSRASNNNGSRTTATVMAAVGSERRLSARERAEQDRQFAVELRQIMDAKGLPELVASNPQELSDRPELVKEIQRRGQYEVARLLSKYAPKQNSTPTQSAAMDTPFIIPPETEEYSQPLRPLGPPPIPNSNDANTPSSVVEKFEAETVQRGVQSRAAPRGGRGSANASRYAQANNEANNGFKQMEPFASSGPSVGERAAHFLQTGKMDSDGESSSAEWDSDDGAMSDGSIAGQKAAMLKAKLRQRSAGLPTAPVLDTLQSQNEKLFAEIQREQQHLQQLDLSERQSEDDFKAQTFQELRRIKDVLASRETEVANMAEALKEARAQLNLLRAKSAAELSQARQEVLELLTRMRNAEKALEGLKQVRVEYWGEGESVELAGSFNGWGYFLTMEPDLSTEIPPPEGGRGPMVFGCDMRLYPGEYEIKFIVDGDWQVDSRREIVSRGLVQNNVLRVEADVLNNDD